MSKSQYHVAKFMRELSVDERERVLAESMTPWMFVLLADPCYAHATDEQGREVALTLLADLARLASESDCEELHVAALRARAIVLADSSGAVDEALQSLDSVPKTSTFSRFVGAWTRGRILLAHRTPRSALAWFEAALALPLDAESAPYRLDALMHGMEAAAKTGRWRDARRWCLECLREARGRPSGDVFDKIDLLAELGWVHWQRGEREVAFAVFHRLVRRLWAMP